MKINILGTEYSLIVKSFRKTKLSKGGLSQDTVTDFQTDCRVRYVTYKGLEHEPIESVRLAQKQTVRHEIVHAFFNESGLMDNSLVYEGPWVHNEEAVDWIANQGEKI